MVWTDTVRIAFSPGRALAVPTVKEISSPAPAGTSERTARAKEPRTALPSREVSFLIPHP